MVTRIKDTRSEPEDTTIPASEAIPGRLYETRGGRSRRVVLAVQFQAVLYNTNIRDDGLAFIHADGMAYPLATDRLQPLAADITWHVHGEASR